MHTIYRAELPYIFNGLLKMQSTGRSSRKFSMAVHAYNLKGGAPVNFQWPIENAIYNLIYPMYPIYPIYPISPIYPIYPVSPIYPMYPIYPISPI